MVATIIAIVGASAGMLAAMSPVLIALINRGKTSVPSPVEKIGRHTAYMTNQILALEMENEMLEEKIKSLTISVEICKCLHGGINEDN